MLRNHWRSFVYVGTFPIGDVVVLSGNKTTAERSLYAVLASPSDEYFISIKLRYKLPPNDLSTVAAFWLKIIWKHRNGMNGFRNSASFVYPAVRYQRPFNMRQNCAAQTSQRYFCLNRLRASIVLLRFHFSPSLSQCNWFLVFDLHKHTKTFCRNKSRCGRNESPIDHGLHNTSSKRECATVNGRKSFGAWPPVAATDDHPFSKQYVV